MNARFDQAAQLFEAAHREDPRPALDARHGSVSTHYHQRLVTWVERFAPQPSEPLALAARCQHIRRWTIAREVYDLGRAGYKQWRQALSTLHAEQATQLLNQAGYDTATIERVVQLLLKQRLKHDPESQALEDAVCLVFLETELALFVTKLGDETKLVDIIKKTWTKMSPAGHRAAIELSDSLPAHARTVIERALAP